MGRLSMKNNNDNPSCLEKRSAVNLPVGSLWGDLRAETGNGSGIEWLLLYEDDPLSPMHSTRLIYVKVVILTQTGREAAENSQTDILSKCELRSFETAVFTRALALAMTDWDSKH